MKMGRFILILGVLFFATLAYTFNFRAITISRGSGNRLSEERELATF